MKATASLNVGSELAGNEWPASELRDMVAEANTPAACSVILFVMIVSWTPMKTKAGTANGRRASMRAMIPSCVEGR